MSTRGYVPPERYSETPEDWDDIDEQCDLIPGTPKVIVFIARVLFWICVGCLCSAVMLYGCSSVHASDDLDTWLRQQADTRAEIWMDSPSDWTCARCNAAVADFKDHTRFRLVVKLKPGTDWDAPVFHWTDRENKRWKHIGYLNMDDFTRRYDRTVNGKFESKPQPKVSTDVGMINHLMSGVHAGHFRREDLEKLSPSRLAQIHHDDHQYRVGWSNGRVASGRLFRRRRA